ncbi:MAG TPA: phosphate ABC transporter substrate-binding protein [Thermoanaerobaculia bacterium]
MISALLLAAATLLVPAAGAPQAGGPPQFRVVAHGATAASAVRKEDLSAIFMRRVRTWPGGTPIVPVDQPPRSAARARFTEAVHGKSVAYVTRYWQRLIFSGRGIPPRELPDDAAVLEFVRSTPGAIGYVDAAAALPPGVREIAVTP